MAYKYSTQMQRAPLHYIPEDSRLSFLPIPAARTALFEHYRSQLDVRWRAEEIKLHEDRAEYERMDKDTQHFIRHGLALFAQFDRIVNINIAETFEREIDIPEIKLILHEQMAAEDIHAHTYSMQINEIIPDADEREKTLNAIQNFPTLAKLHKWLLSYRDAPFAERIIAAACLEGLIFITVFCFIYWIGEHHPMPGLVQANELIARDENKHVTTLTMIYELIMVGDQCTQGRVHEIIDGAVAIGKQFITEALPHDLEGMNKKLMTEYLQYSADLLATRFGYGRLYWIKAQPFEFMEKINLRVRTNFFERHNTNYEKKTSKDVVANASACIDYDI